MPTVNIERHFHPAQQRIHDSDERFRVVAAGRRFGKTRLAVLDCLDYAIQGKRAWWISPTYRTSEVGWRPLRQIASRIPGASVHKADHEVILPGGGMVAIRSADNPDSLRGEGLDFVVMDEAAYIAPEAWSEAIRPALSDRQGSALFISTPRGRNWFWDIHRKGGVDPGWASFTYPTSANPYIDPAEIEAARMDLPEIIFNQEYLADFVDSEGAVFRRVHDAAVLEMLEKPLPEHQYVAGVDVASSVDYTVISVLDAKTKDMAYMDRFNRVDYPVLEDRIAACYARWSLSGMIIEANSIGQGVIDHLQNRGMNIIPFTTTNVTKHAIIQSLQSAFEHGNIKIIDNLVLIGELLSFESKKTSSGTITYAAPDGQHDDCVMSLALALFGVDRGAMSGRGAIAFAG